MPEGDTIFRAARALNRALAGRSVVAFDTGLAKIARVNDDTPLVGRTVERVESRGKWCLLWFSGAPGIGSGGKEQEPLVLVTHMLMSGSWHLYRTGERWRMPGRAMRVMIRVAGREGDEGWEAVAFNVPVVEFHTERTLERSSQVPRLGPDVLAGEFTVEGGVARLEAFTRENPDAEVGVTLLNQRVLAGLGNVYKSEVAFAAGVNPWRAMRTVTRAEMERIVEFSLRYMKANVQDGSGDGIVTYSGNRRTTGRMDREERLWVYGRQGQECRRCGAVVMMRKQGEQARSTYWCPECQPWVGEGSAPVGGVFKGAGRRRASC
jgi:endonuclease-8